MDINGLGDQISQYLPDDRVHEAPRYVGKKGRFLNWMASGLCMVGLMGVGYGVNELRTQNHSVIPRQIQTTEGRGLDYKVLIPEKKEGIDRIASLNP